MRACFATTVLMLLAPQTGAQQALPQGVLNEIKAATVFLKVTSGFSYGSGSGFLIHTDNDYGYIVTNRHVVESNPFELESSKKRQLQAVFRSGTDDEFALKAEVLGVIQTEDLAILRVRGSKKLGRPLALEAKQVPGETTTLYGFGFPFGKLLASSKGSPEISVSRVTVSSLRRDDRRELKTIQLDGALNPGNSGGPVTDSKGRVIGVVVSGVRGSNIAFAIPSAKVAQLMNGSALGARIESKQTGDKGTQVAVTAPLLDPKGQLRSVALRFVREDQLVIEPDREDPAPLPKSKSLELKREGGAATGNLALTLADRGKTFWFQVAYVGADKVTRYTTPANFRVSASGRVSANLANLDQLKGDYLVVIYSSKDGRVRLETDAKMRSMAAKGTAVRVFPLGLRRKVEFYPIEDARLLAERLDEEIGKITQVQGHVVTLEVAVPPEVARSAELYPKFEKLQVKDAKPEPKQAHVPGVLAADAWKRLRHVFEKKQFRKGRLPGGSVGKDGPEILPGEPGILIGVIVTKRTFIDSVQPIFLTAKGEKLGTRIGPGGATAYTLKAQPGYALGALNLRNGELLNAVTAVFMKLKQDGLDVNEAYRSPEIGTPGGEIITVGGDGAFLLGIHSKTLPSPYIAPKGAPTAIGVIAVKK